MKKILMMITALAMTTGLMAQQSIGIKQENLNKAVQPQQDFYDYACGGWMKLHPLTDEYSRLGSFDMVAEENNARLKELVLGLAQVKAAPGSVAQKLSDLYKLSMDSARRNEEGIMPMAPMLKNIAKIQSREDLQHTLAQLYMDGLAGLFAVYVDADSKNARMNAVSTYQGGLTLGQKSYYTDQDKATKNIRKAYKLHIQKMFQLCGYDKKTAKNAAATVLKLETKLAEASFSNVELRDPEKNYNPIEFQNLQKEYPGLNWSSYFDALGLDEQRVIVGQPRQLKEACRMLQQENLEDLKAWLIWQVINESSPYLSDELYQEHFNFFGKTLSGRQAPKPRWKRAVALLNSSLGEALGQLYVQKYFPPEYKARMLQLVGNLQKALQERIQNLSWMSSETKQKATEKLQAFYVKVGYPDKWRDYTDLEIRKTEPLLWNVMAANRFEMQFNLSQEGKPVDKDRWQMTPQTVNAYYNPTTNEICFPAGILQYPFFDMQADDAFNYGAIGVVIGHEMTHGFDDQGSQFDKDGNLNNWWTEEDKQKFQAKTRVLADYFNNIEVLPGLKANGDFTLGENLADHGGLQISFQAFQNATKAHPLPTVDSLTPEQRFFLAYAGVWANNIREAEIRKRVKSDPHSLGRWRVDGALPHIPAWYKAFGITPESPMYVEPEKRCTIW